MLFQPSALTGSLFLVLILCQSPAALATCVAGALGSTLCASLLERPEETYFKGLGGFNGGLVGLALPALFQFSGSLLLVALAGGVLTGLVRAVMLRTLLVPSFTVPFIVITWLGSAAGGAIGLLPADTTIAPYLPNPYALLTNSSQVLFLDDPWTGALVLVAVLLHSRTAAAWVAAASAIAWLTTVALHFPHDLTSAGLLGYNGLVLAAALQHRTISPSLAAAGVVLTVCLSYLSFEAGIAPLSMPFVVSAWVVIILDKKLVARPRRAG